MTLDKSAQQASLAQVRALTEAKLAELGATIELRRKSGLEAALPAIRTDRGKEIMDELRSVVGEMRTREERLLGARNASADASARLTIITIAIWTPLALLLLAVFAMFVTRNVHFGGPVASPNDRVEDGAPSRYGILSQWSQ